MAALLIALIVFVADCTPSAIPISNQEAQRAVDSMVFAKNVKTGLCFGVISRTTVFSTTSTSMSATLVPCNQVKDYLEEELSPVGCGISAC